MRDAWSQLDAHHATLRHAHLRELFDADPVRGSRLSIEAAGLYLDYSKHRVNDETLRLLVELAEQAGLRDHIDAMFRGDRINTTERRAALHVALRTPRSARLIVDGVDVVSPVHAVLDRMSVFAERIRSGTWTGYSGRPIRTVVNIGIGGSNIGPAMAYDALRHYASRSPDIRFLSNVDGTAFAETMHDLDPTETLFIVSSKTFTTIETMTNAQTAREWCLRGADGDEAAIARHFVAVSTNLDATAAFGIDPEAVFGFWDWVGGRFSLDSAIGLSTMVAVGPEHFGAMLEGFHAMDEHFRTAPFAQNMPVLLALLNIWYVDFFQVQSTAVIPYDQYLALFPAYVQQLTMESNGKSVTHDGTPVARPSAPVLWGEVGTDAQHSFFQLLHQGTVLVPCDFIVFNQSLNPIGSHHDLLVANALAQAEALAFGRTAAEVQAAEPDAEHAPHRVFPGNRPNSVITAAELTPATLGALVALYEHSVFTQGVIWDIDSFDQWGVELGKTLALGLVDELGTGSDPKRPHNTSTAELIRRYRAQRTHEADS